MNYVRAFYTIALMKPTHTHEAITILIFNKTPMTLFQRITSSVSEPDKIKE
jgi:hypothetical protein